jgi:hypothetical protein
MRSTISGAMAAPRIFIVVDEPEEKLTSGFILVNI